VKLSIRGGALAAVAAIGTAGLVVPLTNVASAAIPPHVACAKVTSQPLSKTGGKIKATFAQCTPAALAAGGGSLTSVQPNQTSGTLTDKVTWKNGKGTTTMIIKYAGTTIGKCKPPYDTRVKITGKVKSSTGAAAKIVKNGEPVTAFQCAITKGPNTGQSTLEPGTKFKL
jgi:hypothetical protein